MFQKTSSDAVFVTSYDVYVETFYDKEIPDNYEKIVTSLDDVLFPSRFSFRHLRAWELNNIL